MRGEEKGDALVQQAADDLYLVVEELVCMTTWEQYDFDQRRSGIRQRFSRAVVGLHRALSGRDPETGEPAVGGDG